MTTQLDLAGLHNAGTESVTRGQAIAAPAWPTSCFWESLAMAVNGSCSKKYGGGSVSDCRENGRQ